jgi:hypothetical protein
LEEKPMNMPDCRLALFSSLAVIASLFSLAASANAEVPPFAVPHDDAIAFYPTAALHKGDVLQVRSLHLLGDETLVLARCDDGCKDAKVVSVWRHGFHLRNGIFNPTIRTNFALKQDGRYFFQLVKNSQCYVDQWGCRNSPWPGVLTYGNPQPLTVAKAAMDGSVFRVKFDSGSSVFVRLLDPP